MADNLNEKELQALFRKHLPMKQMPADFATQLKKQVLAEVATTLAAKPVASVTEQETSLAPAPIQERAPQRPVPHSVARTQPDLRVGWLEWFRNSFRLTPSMATAGALVMALFLAVIFREQWLGRLTLSGSQPPPAGLEIITPATLTATIEVAVAPTITVTPSATAVLPTDPSAGDHTSTSTPQSIGQDNGNGVSNSVEALEITVVATGVASSVEPPLPVDGSVTPLLNPTVTMTPVAHTTEINNPFGPTATPLRVSLATATQQPSGSSTTVSAEVTPTATSRFLTGIATATPTTVISSERVTTATPTPIVVQLTVVTATRTPVPGLANPTPFVPSPTPTATSVLAPTSTSTPTPTVGVTMLPWRTNTPTVTPTDLPTATATDEPTATETPTNAPSVTSTPEAPPTATSTAPPTPTNTRRPTRTATPLPTATDTPTNTPRPTATDTVTPTNTPRPTATDTVTPTNTPRPTATDTVTATDTPRPTVTDTATATDTPVPTATDTPVPTATDTPVPTPVNLPPEISNHPIPVATVGIYYSQNITATDPDGPSFGLRFTFVEEIGWLSLEDLGNGALKLSGTPSIDDLGVHTFKIQVFDAMNLMTEKEIQVTVQPNLAGGPGFNDVGAAGAVPTDPVPITVTLPISN